MSNLSSLESEFPYSLTISLPLPTNRLASAALRTLQVDAELSPLVRRTFRLTLPQQPPPLSPPLPSISNPTSSSTPNSTDTQPQSHSHQPPTGQGSAIPTSNGTVEEAVGEAEGEVGDREEELTVLQTEYRATTNRMLRVAVNGFMESLGVVLGVMEELDVDVLVGDSI
ncbi:hypothetical protein AJ79_07591 [Helicocarpus griseus UAMH5409]|uniref:Uncharacterized protein n=1 Tax=Helicocarpus griseus UAMH5409 TaxID=1447875 RepID=A0A2B7X1B6_9EURO|nr:hypothetical protein AJ79_07591 [Helicocarpus griseus UAMH5409]